MKEIIINIANDFTDTPGPRYIDEGNFSGELFRKKLLLKKYNLAKKNNLNLVIELDGAYGYPPSFLEEAFGGLVRETKDNPNTIKKIIKFTSKTRPQLIERIYEYIDGATDKKNG